MPTNTRREVLLGLAAMLCPGLAQAAASGLAGKRPNIILVLTDDQGYGDAGCTGNPILKTPNIDRMYGQSVRFSDFHVSPTCSPTRCAIMTGRHEFHSGVDHTINERERMSLKATTIAQVLKSAGYRTGIVGKWHLGDEDAYQPGRRGFDAVFIHGGGGIGQGYVGSCGDAPGNTYFDPVIRHNGVFVKTHGFCTDVFFDHATKWIEQVKGREPFFLYLATNAPHPPLACPPEYVKPYVGRVHPLVATFFGMIANIDENLGRLFDQLQRWGIDQNTLVIFMNDNGGMDLACKVWNAHMRGWKNTPHNGGTRALSLWRWPGTLKPATCDKLTAHIDLFPTFAELAGANIPADVRSKLEGFSLVPLLENPEAPWHDDRMLFTHIGRWPLGADPNQYKCAGCSVRWRTYLAISEKGNWELYDLKQDPGEQKDISKEHADVLAKLRTAYDDWWRESVPLLVNEQAYKTAPKVNPFKQAYWDQFKGPGPNGVPPSTMAPH
ncbi:MAG TPA: arylsulfatase [Tepidisphaeraceae bacterium]|nr:arylsulfatase [Tepidisphaeraceae bacterium]